MRSACVPVISAVVQTGSRTFRSTSGTTLTVPPASAPRARLPMTAGRATAPAAPAALLINSRRDISAPGTVRWCCRISATRSLRAATMAEGRLCTKRQEAASTGARRLDVRLRQPTRRQGDKPASRISDAGFSPALAPKGPFARPSKRSANACSFIRYLELDRNEHAVIRVTARKGRWVQSDARPATSALPTFAAKDLRVACGYLQDTSSTLGCFSERLP